jgi:aspartate ammonia-lyase
MIKRSAALANKELKAVESDKADAIVKACDLELILSKGLMTKDELDRALSKDNILGLK